ncbi:hypothetical protein EMPG_11243 [Blastomyces silverae]|uniref:Uncharacterized protein n=1 Tax=Blastomyces silverae TaxID=2060906 RepID=A0A0H1BRX2_9EURO|nr:hypothetical protein EMPG_11243 [Blastomyces silverae]
MPRRGNAAMIESLTRASSSDRGGRASGRNIGSLLWLEAKTRWLTSGSYRSGSAEPHAQSGPANLSQPQPTSHLLIDDSLAHHPPSPQIRQSSEWVVEIFPWDSGHQPCCSRHQGSQRCDFPAPERDPRATHFGKPKFGMANHDVFTTYLTVDELIMASCSRYGTTALPVEFGSCHKSSQDIQ